MRNKEKREIERLLFKESNNKKDVIENCNKILDVKVTSDCKHTQRRFAIISVACLVFVVAVAMIIFIPPIFKNNEQGTFYYNQNDLRWEDVDDIESFIKENNFSISRFEDNLNNVGRICYYEDTYVGLSQELIVFAEDYFEVGTVLICKSNIVIKDYEEKIYNDITIDGVTVKYLEYLNIDEYISEFNFIYDGYKYYFTVNSAVKINLEYYVKKIVD